MASPCTKNGQLAAWTQNNLTEGTSDEPQTLAGCTSSRRPRATCKSRGTQILHSCFRDGAGLPEALRFLTAAYSSPGFSMDDIPDPFVLHPLGGANTAQLRLLGTMKTLICYEIIFDVNVKWCPFELSNEAWCISTAPNLTS